MPVAPGALAPGLNADGFISNIAFLWRVSAKTANYTVNENESGTIFTTQGATAAVTFTLPATADVTAGTFYIFYNAEDVNMTVTAGTADTMTTLNDVAADSVALSTTSLKAGGAFLVFFDGTNAHVINLTWDAQTVTVATA
jgi:hypothetical protein